MGLPVLILGESGTGKSASLRNFPNDAIAVINVAGKPLPFKNKIVSFTTDDYKQAEKHIKQKSQECKSIVVDDAQYLMANEFMRRATERGYDKFTDIAKNFWELINMVKELPDDVIVYFLAHIERDANGNEKIKTIGKLLDEKITVEGMFTIVLKTSVTDGVYSFLTQNNGHDTVKSPIGMFPSYAIDNDLYYVDNKIRNYYEMGLFLTDEEMAELDKINTNENITKESAEEKKGRRKRKSTPAEDNVKSADAEGEKAEEKSKPRGRRKVSGTSDDAGVPDEAPDSTATEEANSGKEPKRRARKARNEEPAMNEPEESPEEPAEEEKPARRRSHRQQKADEADKEFMENLPAEGVDEEVPFDTTPKNEEAPAARRRRRRG